MSSIDDIATVVRYVLSFFSELKLVTISTGTLKIKKIKKERDVNRRN